MQILKVQDPRDSLDKARRSELVAFALRSGFAEIDSSMPATLIRRILRSKGVSKIDVAHRALGMIHPTKINPKVAPKPAERYREPDEVAEVSADDDLFRQWQIEQAAKAAQPPRSESIAVVSHQSYRDPAKPTMGEVKKECKRRGIVARPTMKMVELLELLNGKDAS